MSKIYAGIDYSMSCPAIFISQNPIDFQSGICYFLTDIKKYQKKFSNITGIPLPKFSTNEERFSKISDIFIDIILNHNVSDIAIEDYSFGSKGQVFHIAENCGILKHKLWQKRYKFHNYAPTAIKKYAYGKGTAKKDQLFETFLEKNIDIRKELCYDKAKIDSPIGDIVDAYFICKFHYSNINQ